MSSSIGHTPLHRRLQVGAIATFGAVGAALAWRVSGEGALVLVGTAGTGMLLADLVSGLVHWGFDTWGTETTPVLGRSFIRPFREHHVDPLGITRHDWIETNGNNAIGTLPVLLLGLALPPGPAAAVCGWLAFWVMATNQIHKWAHQPSVPAPVAWLQRNGLVLGKAHHATHHAAPHDGAYCITLGLFNPLLDAVGFFRGLERAIGTVTGARPSRRPAPAV